MTREQFQEKYKLSLPLKTRKEFEAARRRMGALTKDEKAILSAIVLQKGEAEAAEIFRESPEHLRDYTILKGVNSYAAPSGATVECCVSADHVYQNRYGDTIGVSGNAVDPEVAAKLDWTELNKK